MDWKATLSELKDYQPLLAAVLAIGSALISGTWWLGQWIRRDKQRDLLRMYDARVQFHVDVNFVAHHNGHWVVELLAHVENRGEVPHRMSGVGVNLVGLAEDDPVTGDPERYRGQLEFRHRLVPAEGEYVSLMPETADNRVLVYPATSVRYMYVATVPDTMRLVLIHGLLHRNDHEPLRADRVVAVPTVSTAPVRHTRQHAIAPHAEPA